MVKKKDMDYVQAFNKYKLSMYGDADGDGVRNVLDCKPYDSKRDGLLGRMVNIVSKGKHGQSKEEYEEEKASKKAYIADLKREEREAYRKEYKKARVERAKKAARVKGSTTAMDRIKSAAITAAKNQRKATTKKSTTAKKSKSSKKKSPSKNYVVINGIAYPKYSKAKKKSSSKKKSSKKKSKSIWDLEITDI